MSWAISILLFLIADFGLAILIGKFIKAGRGPDDDMSWDGYPMRIIEHDAGETVEARFRSAAQ